MIASRWPVSLLAALLLSPPAAAQTKYPRDVELIFESARKACTEEGGGNVTFAANTVQSLDLNGDGLPDYIVRLHDAECDSRLSLYCGTAGCDTSILISRGRGRFMAVLEDRIRSIEILPTKRQANRNAVRGIRFELHGNFCGRAGNPSCYKTRRMDGRPFSFR